MSDHESLEKNPVSARRKEYARQLEAFASRLESVDTFNLKRPGTTSPAAWFLGPKGENQELLAGIINRALQEHCEYRREYFPADPVWITEEIKESEEYRTSVAEFERHFSNLVDMLTGSVPFFSYRYQAHMNWDLTMPGMAGYFAAMLYNQNNVAAEASPITTPLEMKVGNDLCEMLGYTVPHTDADADTITPWGHVTCDGSVANLEAMWACRNLKYYPISLAAALRDEPTLAPARDLSVMLPGGSSDLLVNLDTWQLLNLDPDEVLAIPARIEADYGISTATLSSAMNGYILQNLGFMDFHTKFLEGRVNDPVILAPSTMHYSWPKAGAVLGIGAGNIIPVHVDLDARMDMADLTAKLDQCLAQKRPVLMVVAVVGSTEESAVDPLADIIALRARCRESGLVFPVHADAAWGGYFASILRSDPTLLLKAGRQQTPAITMSEYVTRQYEALSDTDSITIDPHKAGYIPYPAGGLCYRNSAMRNLVAFTAPVVYHGGVDPTVGVYGIEGSKPGAAAAGVFLSHRVIRTNRSGYGKLLGKSLFNSKRFYSAVVTLPIAVREETGEDAPYIVVPFQRLPAERAGLDRSAIDAQLEYIYRNIVLRQNDDILADPEAMQLLKELGSDQVIISYSFNFKVNGQVNTDVDLLNALNAEVFDLLHMAPPDSSKIDRVASEADLRAEDIPTVPMIVTSSDFDPKTYGHELVDSFKRRLGVTGDPSAPVTFLISTTMNPWLTDTSEGNFIPTLARELDAAVRQAIAKITA